MFTIYRFAFRLPFTARVLSFARPTPHQRGFWIDRQSDSCSAVGLGLALLYVERGGGPLLRRFA